MKILLKDLNPNPYRDMNNYPIDREKVEELKNSIESTGFWDNTVARNHKGKIQLAYGHHRLKALQELYGEDSNYEVDIPVKDLSDVLMIKIMANENIETWKTSPLVIDETVKAVKKFLDENPIEAAKYGDLKKINHAGSVGAAFISNFLGWPETRVYYSLERLKLIEKGKLSPDVIKDLPHDRAARNFVSAIKEENEKGRPVSFESQRKIVDSAKKHENFSEHTFKADVFFIRDHGRPYSEVEDNIRENSKIKEFEEEIKKLENYMRKVRNGLDNLIRLRFELGELYIDPCYSDWFHQTFKSLFEKMEEIKALPSIIKKTEKENPIDASKLLNNKN